MQKVIAELDIVEYSLADLSSKEISTLRGMTLNNYRSMMRRSLRKDRFDKDVKVAIAKNATGLYLGWALIKRYYNNTPFIMVFVKPKYRRTGVGTALAKHFKNKGVRFCYRWNTISDSFYNSVGLTNVYR